jgi:hypothetical protein
VDELIVSHDRNGTKGLYTALKILGYKPYHAAEIFKLGVPHFRLCSDAIRGVREGGNGRYSKEDFDKWLGAYDAITELACYNLLEDIVAYYPNAKFILTTRDPLVWLASMEKTIIPWFKAQRAFPANILRCFDSVMWYSSIMLEEWTKTCFHPSGNPDNHHEALESYAKQ